MKISVLALLVIAMLAYQACQPDDAARLTGPITGKVGYASATTWTLVDSLSGAQVTITSEEGETISFVTGSGGMYTFENMPAGIYKLTVAKGENQEIDAYPGIIAEEALLHLGGGATVVPQKFLYERPSYDVHITSVTREEGALVLNINCASQGNDYFPFVVFFGDENVSAEHFHEKMLPYHQDITVHGHTATGTEMTLRLHATDHGMSHLVLYPASLGAYNVLGPPSNVIELN